MEMTDAVHWHTKVAPEADPPKKFAPLGSLLSELKTGDRNTALVHLFRAEQQRRLRYRTRLDQTTNWAVTTAATLSTLYVRTDMPHWIILALLLFQGVFLIIEARRYRLYHVSVHRVRLLERGFFLQVLSGPVAAALPVNIPENWEELLWKSYHQPSRNISLLRAVLVRLERNYIFIFAVVLVMWTLKAYLEELPWQWYFGVWIPFGVLAGLLFLLATTQNLDDIPGGDV